MKDNFWQNKSISIVLTYAPFGFGHLRVTDALYDGLPEGTPHTILAADDKFITNLHRLSSVHPVLRYIFEHSQKGIPEDIFTNIQRKYLRSSVDVLHDEISTVISKSNKLKTLLVIATHFGLAHKLAEIKKRIEKERGVKVVLVLQVTDDSPQHIWYVPEADIIFVPSSYTKNELLKYARRKGFRETEVVVNPYPVNPHLGWSFDEEKFQKKIEQVRFSSTEKTHFLLPISGAGVGMSYFITLIDQLSVNDRFRFHFIVKKNVYTQFFLDELEKKPSVELHAYKTDRQVIDEYETEHENKIIAIELTKPSEQAFKALLSPNQIGGSILLFTRPVGRQEYDNLGFLYRHKLIPNQDILSRMWKLSDRGEKIDENILEEAKTWRGLRIPYDPKRAARFIQWAFEEGVFFEMMKYKKLRASVNEISGNGVKMFWLKLEKFLKKL